jgi:hypothetical protein
VSYIAHDTGPSTAPRLLIGLLLALAVFGTLVALQVFQASSEGAATRTHRRVLAALTEIDALIERNYDQFQQSAEAADPGESVTVPDFPIAVPIQKDEALAMEEDDLRARLLQAGAAAMYDDGAGALLDDESTSSPGRFSPAGAVRSMLDLMDERTHQVSAVLLIVGVLASTALAVVLAGQCRGFGRPAAIGLATFAGALPVLVGGAVLRLIMSAASDDGYLQAQLLDVGKELSLLPLRSGAGMTALGLVLLASGAALARWSDSRAS